MEIELALSRVERTALDKIDREFKEWERQIARDKAKLKEIGERIAAARKESLRFSLVSSC